MHYKKVNLKIILIYSPKLSILYEFWHCYEDFFNAMEQVNKCAKH